MRAPTKEHLQTFETLLADHKKQLAEHPDSFFYRVLVTNTEQSLEKLREQEKQAKQEKKGTGKKRLSGNEATATDIPVINKLQALGWKEGDTLLYRQKFTLDEDQQKAYPGWKSVEPDITLQDLNGTILAVIENKLDDEKKDLLKLRTVCTGVLKPRFLYACSRERILFYDNEWRGLEAGEFRQVNGFMSLEEMRLKTEQQKKITSTREISIDTTIAGGYDPVIGKERYYQTDCIHTLINLYRQGKRKMLVHMATGLGKTRLSVAFVKALLSNGLAKKILFVVDRRMLAKQAVDKGFALISKEYPSSWVTTSNCKSRKHANIHVVVIDTLELIHSEIPSTFYDLIIVDECHRSININRKLIFDHFLCPRIGLTATPRIAIPKTNKEIPEEDLAIIDTYKLFGCETGEPDYQFNLQRGIDEGFLAPYKPIELKSHLITEAEGAGINVSYVFEPDSEVRIDLTDPKNIKLAQLNRKFVAEDNCNIIAEQLRKNTQWGEKVILFGVSQGHCIELAKAINKVFDKNFDGGIKYAQPIISDNDSMNETLKAWFEKPYQRPYIAISVDIMSTGVDIPCVRYIGFAALTESVGKYVQMLGRGTRLDPKTGKFSFTILDFVGLCKRMEDNGKGTLKPNNKIVNPDEKRSSGPNTGVKGSYYIIDNPDPSSLVQRVEIHGDLIKIIDNIPIAEARRIFEEELKKTENPVIVDLKEKAMKDEYQSSDKEIEQLNDWVGKPEVYLDETNLQKMYDFPEGSIWDFVLHVIGKKKIPTRKEKIEIGYLSYIGTYPFSDDQIIILKKLKDVFASNIALKKDIDIEDIFNIPVYENLIGSYEVVNKKISGKLPTVINDMKNNIGVNKFLY